MKFVLFIAYCAATVLKVDANENATICSKNEEYLRNSQGKCPECPPRCTEKGIEQKCNFSCFLSGCFCQPGFFRNDKNECLPYSECKTEKKIDINTKCPENQEYLFVNPAEPDCYSVTRHFGRHIEWSNGPGCYCKNGFARHPLNNECVEHKDCPVEYEVDPITPQV